MNILAACIPILLAWSAQHMLAGRLVGEYLLICCCFDSSQCMVASSIAPHSRVFSWADLYQHPLQLGGDMS